MVYNLKILTIPDIYNIIISTRVVRPSQVVFYKNVLFITITITDTPIYIMFNILPSTYYSILMILIVIETAKVQRTFNRISNFTYHYYNYVGTPKTDVNIIFSL